MRIEFDPTNPDEAAAVRAMLTAMHPDPQQYNYVRLEESGDEPSPADVAEILIEEASDTTTVPDTDSTGTPWDARIHSTPPTTNKDGTWRAKRGVKAEEIAAVRAEREAVEANLTATDEELIEQAQPLEIAPAQEQSVPNAPVGEQSAPPAPPASIPPQWTGDSVPENERAVASYSFLDVMKAITAAQKDGKIDTAKVKELCAAVGAGESTMGLNGPDNGDKRGAFMALLATETEGA